MTEPEETLLESIAEEQPLYEDYEYPMVTIVIPTYNSSEKIGMTLDSVLEQRYPDYEVMIIDAGSTDRTLEVVKHYRREKIHIYTVTSFNRYEMINKGILHASGIYVNILFPGDFYIHKRTLRSVMVEALAKKQPHMIYSGTLLRDGRSDPKILFREFTVQSLRRGQQPTSLQSCWFRRNLFKEIGKFNSAYSMRGGYELMCRIVLNKDLYTASFNRVVTDYDLRFVTRDMVLTHFKETMTTIFHYFGFLAVLKWLLVQKDIKRLWRLWMRSLRIAFIGR